MTYQILKYEKDKASKKSPFQCGNPQKLIASKFHFGPFVSSSSSIGKIVNIISNKDNLISLIFISTNPKIQEEKESKKIKI